MSLYVVVHVIKVHTLVLYYLQTYSSAYILYTGKYLPSFYFRPFCLRCQWANLRVGEFRTIFKKLC